jgi:cytoskeleton protein RodZ
MAKGTFGERLKRERELREVSFDEVSKATRIAPRFLEALENEQWEKLPGGVFGRGFVRSIARYLGLSEENLLSEYDLARGESANPALQKAEERIPSPPKWIPAVAVLALLAVLAGLIAGGRYAWKAYQAHRAQKKSSAIVSLPTTAQSQNAATSIASTERLEVTAADPGALLLDLNGQTMAPLGAAGSSGTIVWKQKDLRQTTGGDTQR